MDEQDMQNEEVEEGELMTDNILLEQELPLVHQVQIDHVLNEDDLEDEEEP